MSRQGWQLAEREFQREQQEAAERRWEHDAKVTIGEVIHNMRCEMVVTAMESIQRSDTLVRRLKENQAELRHSMKTMAAFLAIMERQLRDLESQNMATMTATVGLQDVLDNAALAAMETNQCLN
jgi:hypothetical protein